MLTIQPKVLNNYRPAFKANENYENLEEEIFDLSSMDEDTYISMRNEIKDSQNELKDLANNEEFKLPKPLNKAIKGGTIATTAILGGMAGGWGTSKTIEGIGKLIKKKPVKDFVKQIKKGNSSLLTSVKNLGKKFINKKPVQKVLTAVKDGYTNFGKNEFGKSIINFLNKTGEIIKLGYKKVCDGAKYLTGKIKGVKNETYKKYAVNTVGVSSGIASGVTALREKGEE